MSPYPPTSSKLRMMPPSQPATSPFLPPVEGALLARGAPAHELAQALVLLMARGAAFEMRAHARDLRVRGAASQLQVDVLVELLEALVAVQLRPGRPEEPLDGPVGVGDVSLVHVVSPGSSIGKPRADSAAR